MCVSQYKSIMVASETYVKCIIWNSQEITPHDFPDTGVITGTILMKWSN